MSSVDCLQKGINDLCTSAEKWQLRFSADKCFHLRAGSIKSASNTIYSLYGNQLSHFNDTCDLGILIDAQLSFKLHINGIVVKIHVRAGCSHVYFYNNAKSRTNISLFLSCEYETLITLQRSLSTIAHYGN